MPVNDFDDLTEKHGTLWNIPSGKTEEEQFQIFHCHRAFGYCSCKLETKEQYWGRQFCQMERDKSVRPTEITRPVKVDYLLNVVPSIPVGSNWNSPFNLISNQNVPEFWDKWKALLIESFRFEFTANLQPLEVTWQVFRVTFEVYDVRFKRGEVGFHVCHLPESF